MLTKIIIDSHVETVLLHYETKLLENGPLMEFISRVNKHGHIKWIIENTELNKNIRCMESLIQEKTIEINFVSFKTLRIFRYRMSYVFCNMHQIIYVVHNYGDNGAAAVAKKLYNYLAITILIFFSENNGLRTYLVQPHGPPREIANLSKVNHNSVEFWTEDLKLVFFLLSKTINAEEYFDERQKLLRSDIFLGNLLVNQIEMPSMFVYELNKHSKLMKVAKRNDSTYYNEIFNYYQRNLLPQELRKM